MRSRMLFFALATVLSSQRMCHADACTPGSPFPEPVSPAEAGDQDILVADKPLKLIPIYCYSDYNAAAKLATAGYSANAALISVAVHYDLHDKWPNSNEEAGYRQPSNASKYGIQQIAIQKEGRVTINFSDLIPQLSGKSMTYLPVVGKDGKVRFKCDAPAISAMYRRSWCPDN